MQEIHALWLESVRQKRIVSVSLYMHALWLESVRQKRIVSVSLYMQETWHVCFLLEVALSPWPSLRQYSRFKPKNRITMYLQ